MPVNRRDRDRLADFLAALLRGEITDLIGENECAYLDVLLASDDSIVFEFAKQYHPKHIHGKWTTEGIREVRWDGICCEIAFLMTDREETAPLPEEPLRWFPNRAVLRFAPVLMAALVMAGVASLWTGWWLIATVWIGSALLFVTCGLVATFWPTKLRRQYSKQMRVWRSAYPFRDVVDWRQHQALVTSRRVPLINPAQTKPTIFICISRVLIIVLYAMLILISVSPLITIAVSLMLLAWPFLVLAGATMSFEGD